MTTKEMISVMEHFDRGGEVEGRNKNLKYDWIISKSPVWNFDKFEYRIKEKPNVIPWTAENHEILHDLKIRNLAGFTYQVTLWNRDYVRLMALNILGKITECVSITYNQLLRDYTQLDGSPCGTIVNE